MDSIQETPLKKRRLDQAGNSQGTRSSPHLLDDDGEDDYETVATLPLSLAKRGYAPGKRSAEQDGNNNGASREGQGDMNIISAYQPSSLVPDLDQLPSRANVNPRVNTLINHDEDLTSSYSLHSYPLPPNLLSPTQPTQPLRTASPDDTDEVQVLASSPTHISSPKAKGLTYRPSSDPKMIVNQKGTAMASGQPNRLNAERSNPSRPAPGRLALSMAPAGTTFRAPNVQRGPARAEPLVLDSDEEVMPYVGGSSSEDDPRAKGIKPTEPKLRRGASGRDRQQDSQADFSSFMEKHQYSNKERPKQGNRDESIKNLRIETANRSDTLGSAYGGAYRIPKKSKQNGPSRAAPVSSKLKTVNDIEDFQMRSKVKQMQDFLPQWNLDILYETLLQKRNNIEDAIEHLMSQDPNDEVQVNATSPASERDHLTSSPTLQKPKLKPRAKQTLAEPVKSIQERYVKTAAAEPLSTAAARPPRRRLVQGRRQRTPEPSSPAPEPSPAPSTPASRSPEAEKIQDDGDSGILTEPISGLLSFFNSCTAAQLMDLASISGEQAKLILSRAPFKSLNQIRGIEDPNVASGKRKRMVMGDKVVDVAQEMWNGYEAVDLIVDECQRISQDVRNEMAKWGVDIFGASRDGELELLSWKTKDKTPPRDSGIATPTTAARSGSEGSTEDGPKRKPRDSASSLRFFPQPKSMSQDIVLKEYQVVGVNWLDLLFRNRLSGILADDMGLGKTCQVIAFFARLNELGIPGPHVVVVPTSTFENWMREFEKFCPALTVFPYHGSQQERWTSFQMQIQDMNPNVVITTYSLARVREDRKFLKELKPVVCVFDEAHMLKNPDSAQYQQLLSIKCNFRLMLTGTPLQNNLKELVALLGFLLPKVFEQHVGSLASIFHHRAKTASTKEDGGEDTSHAALLSATRIAKAKAMLAPFVLRRKKDQVMRTLPPKTRHIRYCDMTDVQAALYHSELARLKALLAQPNRTQKERENVLMVLRKAAIHPWLFRRGYTDDILREMAQAFVKARPDRDEGLVFEDLSVMTDAQIDALIAEDAYAAPILGKFRLKGEGWMESGKIGALLGLLATYAAEDARTLVFSQFTMVLDILERVFQEHAIKFTRLDGSTPVAERQPLLDMFTSSPDIPVFLLSTKAGGAGINLEAANRVIIFDASFNPQDDVQAENRAHRVGQTRPVEVVRLVTKGTIEEKILALGKTKLALGNRVAGEEGDGAEQSEAVESEAAAYLGAMDLDGAGAGTVSSQTLGTGTGGQAQTGKAQNSTLSGIASGVTSGDEGYDSAAPPTAQEAEAKEHEGQLKVLEMLKQDDLSS